MTVESGFPGVSVSSDHRNLVNVINRINSGFLNHVPYSKLDATAAPTTGDDIEDGYTPGSFWIDVTNDLVYQAIDVTAAAAVWLQPAMLSKANTFTAAQTISSASAGTLLTLTSTDADTASGPSIDLYRDSASPAANDTVGGIVFSGEDSLGNKTTFAEILGQIADPTDGSEDARLLVTMRIAGSLVTFLNMDGNAGRITLTSNDAGATALPDFRLERASASPAAADVMGSITFRGRDSNNTSADYAVVQAVIDDPTDTAEGGSLHVRTILAGATADRLIIGAGLYHGSATGGDKGVNTINFGAVYDDNVLLTDYVFDAALDGKVDASRYNHSPAAAFDPAWLDAEVFEAFWRKHRALPGLPNMETWTEGNRPSVGALAQKAVEMVEVLAVQIAGLNARIKDLESPAGR